tara:strand:- start:2918 stop:3073 length:156 start_codon:yes stop_codon:yes gene_type:complete
MNNIFSMGAYNFYVWLSVIISILVLLFSYLAVYKRFNYQVKQVKLLIKKDE